MASSNSMEYMSYPPYISELRRPVNPPEHIINEGTAAFGTFNAPIKHINFLECSKPCGSVMPNFLKPCRLKQWFAYLIDFNQGFILSAVYDTGLMMFNVVSFFDKSTRRVQSNMVFTTKKKHALAASLMDTRTYLKAGGFTQEITNKLQDGKCSIQAYCPASKKQFLYQADVGLNSISMPSVVVMPLGDNKPLYIHKELFKATGTLTIGNRVFELDEKAICVIDDHKGYYPYHMSYDWISGFKIKGQEDPVAFNLVDNQVVSPDDYNENFIWIKGDVHPIPPIKIIKKNDRLWFAHDEHDVVDLQFEIEDDFVKNIHLPFFKADYRAPFGLIKGTIKDLAGKKHSLEGAFGIGEDLDYRY